MILNRYLFIIMIGMIAMTSFTHTYGEERVRAPGFPEDAGWINAERPLTMEELRGRVVLLDFWTYCCINCMHVLPDLARLEEKYGDRLVVVGVHSAKFEGEKDTDNIRDAVFRYDIHHPVLNDAGFIMWRQLGVRAWPTLVLIDTEGYLVGQVSGEGNYDVLDRVIGNLIEKGDATGLMLPSLPLAREVDMRPFSELRYPGKVLGDSEGQRLFIADSGNNRILVVDSESGEIIDTIGSGAAGLQDGTY